MFSFICVAIAGVDFWFAGLGLGRTRFLHFSFIFRCRLRFLLEHYFDSISFLMEPNENREEKRRVFCWWNIKRTHTQDTERRAQSTAHNLYQKTKLE